MVSDTLHMKTQPGGDGGDIPEIFGDYRIERRIGQGGMASVYIAHQNGSTRPVALKVMHENLSRDASFVQRFLLEAKATLGLKHDHLVELLAFGEVQGRHYLATEFVEGGTVEELQRRMGTLPRALALELFAQLLEGIGFAHQQGLVHRDLKPANLLLSASGHLKIADFGIAKSITSNGMTQTGSLLGTPAYMSPEQAAGKPVDQRSDLFTLGVILYEMLSGKNPHLFEELGAMLHVVMHGPTTSVLEHEPTVDPMLEAVIERLIERDLSRRYANTDEVKSDLAEVLAVSRQRYPDVVVKSLATPEQVRTQLRSAEAREWYAEGVRLAKLGAPERKQATLMFYRAVLLDPAFAEANTAFQKLCSVENVRFGDGQNAKILELERQLASNPDSPQLLQQLANLYRLEGNVLRSIVYYKRYLRLRPTDGYAVGQLSMLGGGRVSLKSVAVNQLGLGKNTASIAANKLTVHASAPRRPPASSPSSSMYTGTNLPTVDLPALPPKAEPTAFELVWAAYGKKALLGVAVLLVSIFVVRAVRRSAAQEKAEAEAAAAAKAQEAVHVRELRESKVAELGAGRGQPPVGVAGSTAVGAATGGDADAKVAELQAKQGAGDHAAVIELASSFLEKFGDKPQAARVLLIRGKSYLSTERVFDGRKDVEDFIEKYPSDSSFAEALAYSAEALGRLNDSTGSMARANQLLTNHPTSPYAPRARLWRGLAALETGDSAAAKADFEQVLGHTGPADPVYVRAKEELDRLNAPPPSAEAPEKN